MGLVTSQITLKNPLAPERPAVTVNAVIDTSVQNLCLSAAIADQLGLPVVQQREITTANSQRLLLDYVGPVELTCGNRTCCLGGLVTGTDVVLGLVPMSELDLMTPATFRAPNALPPVRVPR